MRPLIKTLALMSYIQFSGQALALDRITECSSPHGLVYDQESPKHGWLGVAPQRLSVVFVKNHANEHDIIIKDGISDATIKANSKGYQLIVDNPNHLTIAINTSPLGIFEVFQLKYQDNRTASLVWFVSKNGTPPHGTSITTAYVFTCQY
jgi:hypothetical protein